ncbi:uncharacterized protein [Danio rerio]|uniref:Uncharacterized protein n=1 Tax=Danio rerio TaxID=7955 RepID=A0AC58HPS4_DANRE
MSVEEVLLHLVEISRKQNSISEQLTARQDRLEQQLRQAARHHPTPEVSAHHHLTKLSDLDDIDAYLHTFEVIAEREGWLKENWARMLAPFLTGEAQRAYFSLETPKNEDYKALKKEILARMGLSTISAAQQFSQWSYDEKQPVRTQAAQLSRLGRLWLLGGDPSAVQVAEKVIIEKMMRALPRRLRTLTSMRNPESLATLVEAIELAEAHIARDNGERAALPPRRVSAPWRPVEGTARPGGRPAVPSPMDEPMPTEPTTHSTPAWTAGCAVHRNIPPEAPTHKVQLEGKTQTATLDTGSAITLVHPKTLKYHHESKGRIPITCVHGDTRHVPARRVTIAAKPGSWRIEVGVVPDLPVSLLLGRDWPGFDELLTHHHAPSARSKKKNKPRAHRDRKPALMTTESDRGGESSISANLYFDLFQQITAGGDFGRAQREDETLKHCWPQVRIIDGNERLPSPHPLPHFIVENGLLYCVAERRGEKKTLLVVPRTKRETVLELAHTHPMAGHLGAANTVKRIRDRFHWPGLDGEVKRYCQACDICQRTSPQRPPPSPLIPLPIIDVPFTRIGMDLVGPLPKSARGHEHILVILDYATRYPEAIPLRKATSSAIAKELFLLCSRVGIPTEILTDQGTPFMSRLMADLCHLLKVKQLKTSVYHPQTDGLVERFNKTLKQMLRRVVAEDGRDWDLMIPYVLFGIREVPQASTGFTPFELLFGRQPRGLLDVARQAWEQEPAPQRSVIEHVRDMRERIDKIMPIVKQHLTEAQRAQQRLYNRPAQPREFHPGDKVMILIPTTTSKFLASWKGPYTVVERVGPVNYRVRQPGRRREEQLYHINLMKKWVAAPGHLVAFAEETLPVVHIGEQLSPNQKAELQALVGQFKDVFSEKPGRTSIIQHNIITPPGTIVRQRPYRVPEARRLAIDEEIQKMRRLGIIEPSRSPWSSPIVMVPKPDGTLRFCNDFRKLNEISKFDGYPMPRVDELLDRLGGARFISTIDLTKGYWQLPLSEDAKEKTAFSTPGGHWQYRVLPFGLHGAPATFQRMMDILLRPHQPYAAAYLDDLIVHSESWEEHLSRLRRVLLDLRRAGLTANPKKCHLGLAEARYLGFHIGRGLIQPQQNKVKALQETPQPTTKTQVRAFLGLAGYYRCFIPNFSSIASPLTDLTRKGQPERIRWTKEADDAFRALKKSLTSSPVLHAPDFGCPFILQTDASDSGLGAVLSQVHGDEEHPIMYVSRKLTPAETRYATVEKEALAIKWAILELRYYLLGRKFTLVTDHAPLQWMATAKNNNARVTRWFLSLQDFNFDVQHRAGASHGNADGLSRLWSGWAGLSKHSTPPLNTLLFLRRTPRTRTTLRGGECSEPCNTTSPWAQIHTSWISHQPRIAHSWTSSARERYKPAPHRRK